MFVPLNWCPESKKIEESEELVLNTIGCVTNLSYYGTEENVILAIQEDLSSGFSYFVSC